MREGRLREEIFTLMVQALYQPYRWTPFLFYRRSSSSSEPFSCLSRDTGDKAGFQIQLWLPTCVFFIPTPLLLPTLRGCDWALFDFILEHPGGQGKKGNVTVIPFTFHRKGKAPKKLGEGATKYIAILNSNTYLQPTVP